MKTHSERMAQAAKVAAEYRAWQQFPAGGYVVLWRMKGAGWTRDLTEPQRFEPGALAVAENGQVLRADGGDYWDGAAQWTVIFEPVPAPPAHGGASDTPSVTVDFLTAQLIRRAFLPLDPSKMRHGSPEVVVAVKTFIAACDAAEALHGGPPAPRE